MHAFDVVAVSMLGWPTHPQTVCVCVCARTTARAHISVFLSLSLSLVVEKTGEGVVCGCAPEASNCIWFQNLVVVVVFPFFNCSRASFLVVDFFLFVSGPCELHTRLLHSSFFYIFFFPFVNKKKAAVFSLTSAFCCFHSCQRGFLLLLFRLLLADEKWGTPSNI